MTYDMSRILTLADVPDGWIYKDFYKYATGRDINQPLDGRTIKIRSFISRDTIPSLCLYVEKGKYRWRDFSTGKGGDTLDFVMNILNKELPQAIDIVLSKYNKFISEGSKYEVIVNDLPETTYKLFPTLYTKPYLSYWSQYCIGIQALNKFKVRCLPEYVMYRGGGQLGKFCGHFYAYYEDSGHAYQIYRPGYDPKYINIRSDYLIGLDQLEGKSDTLVIASGMKDLLALSVIGLSLEIVALPTGEAHLLDSDTIALMKDSYKNIITILDNDKTGISSMKRYEKVYGIPYVWIDLCKDLAENNKTHDLNYLKSKYTQLIDKKIE